MPSKSWFRIRNMGWTPCSRQGWVVLLVYITVMFSVLDIKNTAARRLSGGLCTGGIILIAMWKTQRRSNKP